MPNCKHCQNGKENEYGDIWYVDFPCYLLGAIYHRHPRIYKRNNRYWLDVDRFSAIEIKACPICGRSLTGEN